VADVIFVLGQHGVDGFDQELCSIGRALEERVSRHLPRALGNRFDVGRHLSCFDLVGAQRDDVVGQISAAMSWVEHRQSLPCPRRDTQRNLCRLAEVLASQQIIEHGMGDLAARCGEYVGATAHTEAGLPIDDRHSKLGAVAEVGRQFADLNLWDLDPADALQGAVDESDLASDLFGLGQMLPVAATTAKSNLAARGLAAPLARLDDLDDLAAGELLLLLDQLKVEHVSNCCSRHKNDSTVVKSADAIAADSQVMNGHPRLHPDQATVRRMSARPIEIVPSVLPADFSRLGEECQALEKAGVDRIQWDVMDGHFVPNLTFGPDVIASCRSQVDIMFEAHLMVERPDDLLDLYLEAGCQMAIVHVETCSHLHRTLGHIREMGAKPAAALNPSTPLDTVANVLDLLDMVLIMTVNPGFGGQAYISTMEPKVRALREMIDASGHDVDIEVDGGISATTISGAAAAGANVLVSGSALYKYEQGLEYGVADLRRLAEAAAAG
jgi:ribulose-phosphate 3-epimerase